MNTIKKTIVAMMTSLLVASMGLGCNTVKGAGKDIQHGGQAVENAAQGAQK